MLSPLLILLTPLFLLLLAKRFFSNNIKNLPPGPPKLPVIGNLHQLGPKPHVSAACFAKRYGPLVSLRLGTQVVVVASSPEAATAILKTQDRLLSSRMVPTAFQHKPLSILWSDCTESWRNLRTLCWTEMFSSKALEAHRSIRERKQVQLLEFLRTVEGQAIDAEKMVFTTLLNTLSCIVLGQDLLSLQDEHAYEIGGGLRETFYKILAFGGHTKDFGSFFPILQRFDVQGIRRGGMQELGKTLDFWGHIIQARRALVGSSTWSSNQARCLLDRLLENGFSNEQIDFFLTELFISGSITTTTALEWAMAELARNKEAIIKLEEEIKREIKTERLNMSQLHKLPYLQACVKESLRLHPPAAFLIPRKASETCQVMSYTIPKDASVLVNIWAMGRDPKVWDDPLSFKPERFLGSNVDYKGHHFEFLPFGSGRRTCPGLPYASMSLEFMIATLVHEFEWALPNGEDPMKLNMEDQYGLTLKMEKPLQLVFKRKQLSSMHSLLAS